MIGSNIFARELLTDRTVLPRARVIYLARVLCRADIVAHLMQSGRKGRTGQLPARMEAMVVVTERALMGFRPTESAARAGRRLDAIGATRGQRVYVWAAAVDAYLTAGRLAGYKPSERDLWAYHAACIRFGQQFGVSGDGCITVDQIEAMASRLLGRVAPDSVPLGGWVNLMQATNAEWFRCGSIISQADVIGAIEEAMPTVLVAALRRN